jgi:hypothetical protein
MDEFIGRAYSLQTAVQRVTMCQYGDHGVTQATEGHKPKIQ